LAEGGTTACVINAANEIAVDAFLKGRIRFTDIYSVIDESLQRIDRIESPEYPDFVAVNTEARAVATEIIEKKQK
jgi:1-deoxy-D-xylulose-5-phosphate reductoisomerase